MRVTPRTTSRESAFTIIEIIIGALIVTAVFAGAMYFIVGSGKSQQKSLARQRMAAAADDIMGKVRANDQWLRTNPGCKTAPCDVSGQFPVPPPKAGDPKLDARVLVAPIDSAADGTGPADDDGVRPDFYRIEVTLTMTAAEQKRWGRQNPFEAVSTIDATAIGLAVGSIVVQTCEVVNQVDERMSFAGCSGGTGNLGDMNAQPAPCASPFPLSWTRWMSSRPVLDLGCNTAFDAAVAKDRYLAGVATRGTTGVTFTLQRETTTGGPATTRSSADADTVAGDGVHTFTGLPAGTYKITVNAGNGRELWRTKTIPSALKAGVQANQEARALIMVRPRQGLGQYGMRFTRAVWIYRLRTFEDTEVYDETDPEYGITVRTTTHYTYLTAEDPERQVWNGPAWTGIASMEAKPFDRYRDATDTVAQPTELVQWAPVNDPNGGWYRFGQLPTGLHSVPEQQPTPSPLPPLPLGDLFGSFGTRTHTCVANATPGGSCGTNRYAWLDHRPGKLGDADSSVAWHSEDGECYIESSVAGYPIARRLQNGGGHAERCSQDLIYVNSLTGKRTVVEDFLPDKQGNGGGTMVLSMWQETECLNCPEPVAPSTGTVGAPEPSSTGSNPSVGSRTSPKGPRTSAAPPKVTVQPPTPPPTPTNPNPPKPARVSLPAATAVPMANSGGGGGGALLTR